MNSKRVYYLLLGVIVLVVAAIFGGVYGINGLLAKQSTSLVATKATLVSLNAQQTELTKSKKDIATYSDLYNISRTVVPQSKNQVQAVRQIVNLAAANGVQLQSITFPASSLGATSIASGAAATSSAPIPQSNAAANLSQLTAVPGIAGVYDLQLVVTSSTGANQAATYPQLINFLSALEQNRQTALVSKITITPAATSSASSSSIPRFTFVLTLDIYIKP